MPVNGPKVFTVRKVVNLTPDQMKRAQRMAHRYGGSVNEVLREGIAALEREHERAMGAPDSINPTMRPECIAGTCAHYRHRLRVRARED